MDSRNHVIFLNITLRYFFVFLFHYLPNRIAIASKNVSIKPDKYAMGLFFCFIFLIRKIYDLTSWTSGERKLVNTYHLFTASQVALMVKSPPANAGDKRHSLIPGWGRSSGEEHGDPLKYSCLENPHGQRSLVGYSP